MDLSANLSKNFPLVSIIVITYNSSKYVLETLESAKSQTYQNIELIVSDDCSDDDTIEICRNWIKENKEYFVHTELITTQQNSGVTRNCNRGLHASTGEWLKFIAGDDTITNNAIYSYIEFSLNNIQAKCIFSNTNIIDENGLLIGNKVCEQKNLFYDKRKHYRQILKASPVALTGMFIRKDTLLFIGGFDERFEMHEDFPLMVKLAQNGVFYYYLNLFLYNYRKSPQTIWSDFISKNPGSKGMRFYNSTKSFYELELLPALRREKMIFSYFKHSLWLKKEVKRIYKKKTYKIYSLLYLITDIIKFPRHYLSRLIRKFITFFGFNIFQIKNK